MNSSSKLTFKSTPFRHDVLKPNPKILSLLRSLRSPRDGRPYKYAVDQNFGVRKYQISVESLQQALREAQWRHDCPQPVLRCLYVELLSPGASKQLSIDLYVEHMEVNLGELSHLLLSEAIYIIMESIKGYEALLDRYRKVSVQDECIGICSGGQLSVWINRFHEKSVSGSQGMVLPVDIIEEIVRLVKERSEPVCRTYLGKIEQYLSKQRPSWGQMLEYLKKLVVKHDVKIPENLRYLLHQHRIKKNLSGFKSMKISINDQEEIKEINQTNDINIVIKSPRFCQFLPSQIRTRTNSNDFQLFSPKYLKKDRKYSGAEPQSGNMRRTLGVHQKIKSSVSLKPNHSEYKLSCKQSDNNSSLVKTKRKLQVSKDRSVSSHKSKIRCKSQSSDNINIVNKLFRPRGQTVTAKALKRCSGISENTKPGSSHIKKSRMQTNESNFSFEAQTVKKIGRKASICIDSLAFKQGLYSEDTSPIRLCEQHDKPMNMSPQQSLQPTFQCIPQVLEDNIKEQVLRANNWIKTFKNLMNQDGELNISITDGQEISTYLSDVQLTRLDTLSRQMVVSLLPQGSDRQLKQLRDALNK